MCSTIFLPQIKEKNWEQVLLPLLKSLKTDDVTINCGEWYLNCKDIIHIANICERSGLTISSIESFVEETIVSVNSLGYNGFLKLKTQERDESISNRIFSMKHSNFNTLFHQGTLRSGQTLEADGDLLILGDVNPGAIISANGSIIVWGKLRGIAHAGKNGNNQTKISALQLRPVQLRISNKIARGPNEKPEEGQAEEALIEDGIIVIKPARNY